MLENLDYTSVQSGDIVVSVCPELLDKDNFQTKLWGYCLRIENNSGERIRLMKKNLCLTDNQGNSYCSVSLGFNGELPDLEPGEFFEFEDTTSVRSDAAVLYGFCDAITTKGKELKINLPLIELSSSSDFNCVKCKH